VSIEENKAIVRRYLEPTSAATREERRQRMKEVIDPATEIEKSLKLFFSQLFVPDYIEHLGHVDMSCDELAKWLPSLIIAFPDLDYRVGDIFGEGDKVAARYSATGTHLGTFIDIPPTGKKIEINGMYIARIAGGKIAEGWVVSTFFNFEEMPELIKLWLSGKS
jgi:predicted ester cyclase